MKHLHFIGFCIFLICYLFVINGCGLMKKTTTAKTTDVASTSAIAELTQLDLSKATKETNEYFYRTDGTLIGHKNIKEQVDQAGYGTAQLESNATAKKDVVVKESTPDKTFIWVGAVILSLLLVFVIARLRSNLLGRV